MCGGDCLVENASLLRGSVDVVGSIEIHSLRD